MSVTVRGGDVAQYIQNGREYDVADDATVKIILAGFVNESKPTGNGGIHTNKKRKLGGLDGIKLSIDSSKKDLEAIQEDADNLNLVPVSITLASGFTYGGNLTPNEATDGDATEGMAEYNLRGPKFTQI